MARVEKFPSTPYWCQLYELAGAREKEVQAALEFWKTAAIYCDINNAAEAIPLAPPPPKKTLKLFKSKDSAGALGSIPFETHSSILSSLGCTKTTSPRFICERIRTFLLLPLLLLLLLLLPRTGYNYPAVLKHTNLIEQRNQCGIVLLGLLRFFSSSFFSFFFLEKKNSL